MTSRAPGGDAEAELRAYLLGTLDPERQHQIDARFLEDEALHEELQATADDLIHAHLAGQLSAADSERFETHFLASPRRRERVAFMRSLLSAVEAVEQAAPAPPRGRRLPALLPWAAVLLVALSAGLWSGRERAGRERQLAEASRREDALRLELRARDERVRELEERARTGGGASDIATWALRPGADRGSSGQQAFTVGTEWIRLRVLLEHDLPVRSYRASLQTSDGREVLRLAGLREVARPEGRTLDVMVPGGLLRTGAYLLSIQRDTSPEELTATTFLVR